MQHLIKKKTISESRSPGTFPNDLLGSNTQKEFDEDEHYEKLQKLYSNPALKSKNKTAEEEK